MNMTRPPRIEFKNGVYHISAYGVDRIQTFINDDDRDMFLKVFAATSAKLQWICHGFCLMNDHYHLLIETPEANLSKGMRQLNGVYTQHFNRSYNRVGPLFQGRFKSILVEKETYLLDLARHIILNPVRLGIVEKPSLWPWSSYNATGGHTPPPPFLNTSWLLEQFGSKQKKAQKKYRRFVKEGANSLTPLLSVRSQIYLGSDDFIESIQKQMLKKRKKKTSKSQKRINMRPTLEDIFIGKQEDKTKRNKCIKKAHGKHGYSLKEIGCFLQLHYTTISKILKS